MKILKKILCGLAVSVMGIAVGTGISFNNDVAAKADDASKKGNFVITKIETAAVHGNPNEFLLIYVKGTDYPTGGGINAQQLNADKMNAASNYKTHIGYNGADVPSGTGYGDFYFQFWQRTPSFTIRINGSGAANSFEIKPGLRLPAHSYLEGSTPEYYECQFGYKFERLTSKHATNDTDSWKVTEFDNPNAIKTSITHAYGNPTNAGGFNMTFALANTDWENITNNTNVNGIESISTNIKFYDFNDNEMPFTLNSEKYLWSNHRLLIQFVLPEAGYHEKVYKAVISAGAIAPSWAFATTDVDGDTYITEKECTLYRPLGNSDDWYPMATSEVIDNDYALANAAVGYNGEANQSYNIMFQTNAVRPEGDSVRSPVMYMYSRYIHAYDKQGTELTVLPNGGEQYFNFSATSDFLTQVKASGVVDKFVVEKDALLPSYTLASTGNGPAYKMGSKLIFKNFGDETHGGRDYRRVYELTFGEDTILVQANTAPEASSIPTPTAKAADKEYTYTGYWKDASTNERFDPTALVNANASYVVDYDKAKVEYKVSYLDENGKSLSMDANFAWDTNVTTEVVPAKTGYNGSWEVTEGGVTIEDGKFTMPKANVTLKAKYVAKTYTLSFEGIEDQITVTYDAAIGTLPDVPAKTGYHDGKWTLNDEVITAETVWKIDNNAQAVASYTIDVYTVTFDSKGGSAVDAQQVNYNEKATKPADPVLEGKVLSYWALNDEEFNFDTPITASITLEAVWETATYTVSFDTKGGSDVESQTVAHGALADKPDNPVKAGSNFVKWTLNDQEFDFNTPITASITLVAVWDVQKFTVTFDSDGGETVDPQTVEYGACAVRPNDPGKLGCVFEGWVDASGALYNFSTPVTADITLKAKWSVAKYTVSFDTVGGSAVAAQTVEHGKTATKPSDPTKSGYTFKGWVTADGTAYDFSSPVLQNFTIYASWEKNAEPAKSGCGSSIIASSAIIALVAVAGVALISLKKKED